MGVSLGWEPSSNWDRRTWLVAVPLALIVIAAFIPALDNGFVKWDDDKNFLDNPFYRGLGGAQIRWAWTYVLAWRLSTAGLAAFRGAVRLLETRPSWLPPDQPHPARRQRCCPVCVDVDGAGSMPARLLFLESPWGCSVGAGLASALFAVHPLRVEAVAWASCQPYLPCALFSMLAVLAYLRGFGIDSSPRRGWLVVSFRPVRWRPCCSRRLAVSLPVVLLILDVYPLRRFGNGPGQWFGPAARRACWEKVPFVIVSLVFMGVAIAARRQSTGLDWAQATPPASIAQACYGIWFYLQKTVLPVDLDRGVPAAQGDGLAGASVPVERSRDAGNDHRLVALCGGGGRDCWRHG